MPVDAQSDAPRPERPRPGALSALLEELVANPDGAPGSAWETALRPGAVVGRFELVRELGRGGFGVVYEARDTVLGRSVAFKAVRPGGRPDAREERLLREAEAAARLAHPNIVTLHDVGRSEHGPYLVLELLRGRTLAARLEQGPIALGESLRIAVEVAKGLAYAHEQGVIHRDLTPGNVFLCDDGQVKVLDLGMAHAFGRRKVDGGTPSYMAPEQLRGAPEDERTDVFALGVVLYRMLSGELPYAAEGEGWLVSRRAAPAIDVPELPGVGHLVARMVSRDPTDRPRDAGEVLAALTAYQQELLRTPASGAVARVRARHRWPRRVAALVGAAVLLGGALAGVLTWWRGSAATEPSVAVLPFADLSPEKDQGYFSDGLAEEIQNALAHVEGLRVTGRSSALALKGAADDLPTIGRKLDVRAVLQGSVRKAGSRVRVTAQLVDLRSGHDLWSESFDRDLADIFAVQDDIARAVVSALRVKLLAGQAPSTRAHRTANSAVYTEYLLGRQFYSRFTPDDAQRAVEAFERALALDPSYAPAWSALSVQLTNLGSHVPQPRADRSATLRRALQAAEKAIALDPDLAEGYAARSLLRAYLDWDFRGAQEDIDRALALAPGDADTQRRYGVLLGMLGRDDEAIAATRRALDLDPLVPANWVNLASSYVQKRQLALARTALDRALEISPDMGDAHLLAPLLLLLEGQPAKALAAIDGIHDEVARLLCTAIVEHTLGHDRESQRALDPLVARYGDVAPIAIAGVYVWRGELDHAFEWLDRAYARHDTGLAGIHQAEILSPGLRRDPRFRDLLRRIGLPASD